jgi:hypothetical protein
MANWNTYGFTIQLEVREYIQLVLADLQGHVEGYVASDKMRGSIDDGHIQGNVASAMRGSVNIGDKEGFISGPNRGSVTGKDHG